MKKGVKSGTKQGGGQTPPATVADDALWLFVTRSVKPLAKKARRTAAKPAAAKTPPKAEAPKTPAAKAADQRAALPRSLTGIKTAPVPPPAPQGFDRATETRLKKGKLGLEGRIDLHGMTQNEAHAALSRFIRASVRQEKRTVLVITGKGRVGGGTLRRAVPMWLEDPEFRKMVIAATPAQPKDGGDGALYVRLRRQRD
ncbi:MAG: Smr/MutS family protein [Micavibrio sp.]|nr:Smr/MutS family protein [Micavibrio sp.]